MGHRIVRAMFVVIFFQFFWKFGGLIITVLVGSVFRAGAESDAYLWVSESVVFLLQTFCLKVFIPVVVPIFKEQLAENGEKAAWRFGSTVLTLAVVVLAAVTAGGMLFAPRLTATLVPGFHGQRAELTTRLMRLMFPGVFALCLATVTYALLNSYNVFGFAAAGDALQKMLWAGIFLAASFTGLAASKVRMLDALALAFLVGATATLLTHLVGLRTKLKFVRVGLVGLSGSRAVKEAGILAAHVAALAAGLWACRALMPGKLSEGGRETLLRLQQAVFVVVAAAYLLLLWWRARRRQTAMAKFAALAVPLLFGILFAKYRDLLTNLFASFTGTGVFSDLKYARKIGEAPNTLIIAALSIAILPHLCELATGKKWTEFAGVMTRTIRIIVIFFVPLAALTVVLRRPIIQLLFDRGNWTDYHLVRAGDALGLYILSLPFFAIENPIQQSFFAMQRMWTPTLVGFLGTGFHILFLFVGIEWLGYGYFGVVALVYVVARAFKNVILLGVMRAHVKILPWRESTVFLAKAAVITAAVVLAAHVVHRPVKRLLPLAAYRQHEVMLDTFNVELRGWESENVDEFRIVPKRVPLPALCRVAADAWARQLGLALADATGATKDHRLLQDAFPAPRGGPESAIHGENALMVRYRRSPRRSSGLRRDLSELDLSAIRSLAVDVAVSDDAQLTLELLTRGPGPPLRHEPIAVSGGARTTVKVAVKAFHAGERLRDVVALWIRDTTAASRVAAQRTTLLLDNLTLFAGGADRVAVREDFERSSLWRGVDIRVEDTGERAGSPELALHVPPRADTAVVTRSVAGYRLAGCDTLRFKAKADKPATIHIGFWPGMWESAPAHSAKIEIAASDTRRTYSLPLSAFTRADELDLASGPLIQVSAPAGVDFWLDNVAFVRSPGGVRLGGLSAHYEAFKLAHVAVPSAAALVVFVALLIVLRVEDARSIGAWLRDRVLGKVLARLRRR